MKRENRCYCGNEVFWDEDANDWLCPGRFDGEHNLSKQHEYEAKLAQIRATNIINGGIGGRKRAETLSPQRRSTIASNAANQRWNKRRSK